MLHDGVVAVSRHDHLSSPVDGPEGSSLHSALWRPESGVVTGFDGDRPGRDRSEADQDDANARRRGERLTAPLPGLSWEFREYFGPSFANIPSVESWRESNPRPSSGNRPCYDHSRDCGSTATAPPGRWSSRSPPGLSPMPAVFPAASGLSRRHPLLLLPGCSGQAPRALTGRDDSRSPNGSGGESEVAIGASFGCPVLGV